MKGIYRFVKRVYRNVIERNHRRSLLESYGKESIEENEAQVKNGRTKN